LIKLFLIGLIGGLLSGILGIGGGIVFVPLLTYLTKEDFKINTGISSLAIVFVASASAVSYIVNGLEISSYVLYLIIGAVIGNFLKIEEKIKNFGDYLYSKFEKSDPDQSKFIESYLTTTLIVITGPLAIIGPFFDVVESNLELLLIKTALDCFLVMFITSSGGKGAVYSGVSILIYQGFFTLCALLINTNIDQVVSDSIAGIGGVLLIGVGINLLGLKKIPVGNYMLSLFVPFILTL